MVPPNLVFRPWDADAVLVDMIVAPQSHSVVRDGGGNSFWHPTVEVEAGDFLVHVGGGQPGFTAGVLNATVSVAQAGALTASFGC